MILLYLFASEANSHSAEDDLYTIRACSRTFPVNKNIPSNNKELSHCFFMFSQNATRLSTRGFFDNENGGIVLQENEMVLANSKITTDPIFNTTNRAEATKVWGDVERCYEREIGKYNLIRNNCCTVANRCLDMLLKNYSSQVISKDSHIRDVVPSKSFWDKRETKDL